MPDHKIIHADALATLKRARPEGVDAIVTDPPYELGFMGKTWDSSGIAYSVAFWTECLRVLKPGGHLLAFGGTRTYHRLAVAIEDAGFEIRDSIHWVYGSGFPKSQNVSKAIDKAAGAEREVVGRREPTGGVVSSSGSNFRDDGWQPNKEKLLAITAPATPEARRWDGWGTALKPSHEPIVVARKPLGGTVARNVLEHGTGAINVDGCRVGLSGEKPPTGSGDRRGSDTYAQDEWTRTQMANGGNVTPAFGRWPTNLVLTHPDCDDVCADDCPVAEMDRQSGIQKDGVAVQRNRKGEKPNSVYGKYGTTTDDQGYGGEGGASRFFPVFRYQAKAAKKERPVVQLDDRKISHPTVKPVALMRWLVRLVTPPGGVVLDPFAGSGTTIEAAELEGFRAIGIEADDDSILLINERMSKYEEAAA